MRLLNLISMIFLIISCSSDDEIAQEDNSLDIKRMEVTIRFGESQFIFDNTSVTGLQRSDTLTTAIRAGANLQAEIALFTETDNEVQNVTVQIQRNSTDYQLFF